MERQAKGQESQSPMQDELRGAKAHDDRHSPVQIYGHTAQGASNAQVDAMCRNLKLGTVLGKTQACPITTVAWFVGVKRVPQTAARVEQISEWITIRRNCNVDTRRRIRRFWRKKAPMMAGNPPSLESGCGTYLCHHLLGDGSQMEAELTGFLAVTGWQRPLWTAPCLTRRRSSTVSPVTWRCKHGKQRPGILPVPVWREVSSQISPRKPGLS